MVADPVVEAGGRVGGAGKGLGFSGGGSRCAVLVEVGDKREAPGEGLGVITGPCGGDGLEDDKSELATSPWLGGFRVDVASVLVRRSAVAVLRISVRSVPSRASGVPSLDTGFSSSVDFPSLPSPPPPPPVGVLILT